MDWLAYKDEAARLAFEKDALHIYVAVAIQVAAALVSRRSIGHWLPWLAVLSMECINELLDFGLSGEPELRPWQVVAAVHDFVNTMIMPTALLLLCRHLPGVLSWSGAQRTGTPRPEQPVTAPRSSDRP